MTASTDLLQESKTLLYKGFATGPWTREGWTGVDIDAVRRLFGRLMGGLEDAAYRASGDDACWIWSGPMTAGTPRVSYLWRGRHLSMNAGKAVLMFLGLVGWDALGLPARARCERSELCVNPWHLAAAHGGALRRSEIKRPRRLNGMGRLSEADVQAICRDRRPIKEIAAAYGIQARWIPMIRRERLTLAAALAESRGDGAA